MKASELRIGNKIMDISGFIGSVSSIHDDETVKLINDEGVLLDWMRADLFLPIPLTEEILLKCGFEPFGSKMNLWGNKKCYIKVKNWLVYKFELLGCYIYLDYDLKHLHQLQNLYFSLTNEELKIKL